jgi:hypothetical protein
MSQVNDAVSPIERRDLRRLFTVAAVVAAMGLVAAVQLRQEAARTSATATAPASLIGPAAPAR